MAALFASLYITEIQVVVIILFQWGPLNTRVT